MYLMSILLALLCSLYNSHATSQVTVINLCPFSVYLASVQQASSSIDELAAGESYTEMTRPALNGTGVSIKITSNSRVGEASTEADRSNAFDSSPKTQFEYSYVPLQQPTDLYYDLSDINDAFPRQFCRFGIALLISSSDCPDVLCPPNCDGICPDSYNNPNDNYATKGCQSGTDIALTLCAYSEMTKTP